LLVLLALLVRAPRPQGLPDRERGVGITLVHDGDSSVEYFVHDETTSSDTRSGEAPPTDTQQDRPPVAEADLAELNLPEVTLPGPATVSPTTDLVPELEYTRVQRGTSPSLADIRKAQAADAELLRQRGMKRPSTEVSMFGGAPAIGNSFVFVVDRSDSMGRGGLGVISRAKREFQNALAGLEPVHKFQIIAYNHQNTFFLGKRDLVAATVANKRLVDKFMGGIAAFGATNHFAALLAALHRRPDVIFLLTDGGQPSLTRPQRVQILKLAQGRTTIHCLQFGSGPTQGSAQFMQQLAQETGGTYRYLDVTTIGE
jgi:hypothetical protein